MIFNLPPIFGLFPLLLYILLSFKKNMHVLTNILICVVVAAIMVKVPLPTLGTVIYESMGSFLALIGFIIMLGSGLGVILRKTGAVHVIVFFLIRKIGIKTQKRAILTTMACTITIVTMLGTLAGANAVIAPLLIPLVSAVGITPATLAVIFQGAGQTGQFLCPFSPCMVTLMSITGLPYSKVLLFCSLPVSIVMWIGTYFIALKVQKETEGKESYSKEDELDAEPREITAKEKRATVGFLLSMAATIVYAMITNSGASFVIFIMIVCAIVTGLCGGLSASEICDSMMEGAGKMVYLYFMLVLFTPFLNFISQSGAFDALVSLIQPLFDHAGKMGFSLLTILVGIFGINGAAIAQALMIDSLFNGFLPGLGISMPLWGMIVLIGSQITSYAYPGIDMIGQMGLARSNNVKAMLKLAYYAIIPSTVILGCIATFIL